MRSRPGADCWPGCSPEMGTSPAGQALVLLLSLLLGIALGLLYDLLRPPRREGGALLRALLDLFFALAAAAAAFVNAMGAGNGRLGLWELSATLLGFLLYLHLLSPGLLPLLEQPYRVMRSTIQLLKKEAKKLRECAKKSFQTRKNGLL